MPYFSVVIPVYNKGPHIQRSINSVLGQTFKDFELILVNDASTDNSLEEIKHYNDNRIRTLSRVQPGPGGYAARNLGINESQAEWVAFLDADDEWYPDHLEKMYLLSNQFPYVCFMGCGWENRYGNWSKKAEYYQKNHVRKAHLIDIAAYLNNVLINQSPVCTSVACVRKSCTIIFELFPANQRAKRGGDLHAWLKIMCCHKQMAWSGHVGAIYHRDSVNMVTRTAPYSYTLLSKDIYKELSSSLSLYEKILLKKYFNKRLGNVMKGNINAKYSKIILWDKLYWRGDFIMTFYLVLISLIPRPILKAIVVLRGMVIKIKLSI